MATPVEQQALRRIDPLLAQLPHYRYRDIVRRDLMYLIARWPSLNPTIGTINFDRTQTMSSICLQGTIPMVFKNTRYNIPVNIWVLYDYPYRPPLAYVKPTQNMSIKPSHRNVDQAGKCHIQYLSQWSPQTHNLSDLASHLSATFGADPPVYQNPSSAAPTNVVRPNPHHPPHPPSHSDRNSSSGRVPPPPPNSAYRTLELRRSLNSKTHSKAVVFVQENVKRTEQEMDTQSKLTARAKKLEEDEKKLQEDRENFERDIEAEERKHEELNKWIEENKDNEVDVDKAIDPSGIHAKQLRNIGRCGS